MNRLVVHLHAVPLNHQGTTNEAWIDFRSAHPDCLLRLTVIHAYSAIKNLHLHVLKEKMPLSHIKVFFCENVSFSVFFFQEGLKNIFWFYVNVILLLTSKTFYYDHNLWASKFNLSFNLLLFCYCLRYTSMCDLLLGLSL